MRRLSKINWRRDKPKMRKPVPMVPGKVILPDDIYNRHKEKKAWKRGFEEEYEKNRE